MVKLTDALGVGQEPLTEKGGTVPLSEQQQAVIDWAKNGKGHAFVEARAGSGKTYTLVAVAPYLRGSVTFAVFNKRNQLETVPKLQHLPNVRVKTCHSIGFGAWRRVADPRVDADQKWKQMMEAVGVPKKYRAVTGRLVSMAKQSVAGLIWDPNDRNFWEDIIEHHNLLDRLDADLDGEGAVRRIVDYAQRGLEWAAGVGDQIVDFDDMLWLPLIENSPFYKSQWFLMDEAQDTNVARRLIAEKCLRRPGGRSIWVGDRHQAIYGFQGASSSAVDEIIERFRCTLLPLTVTFRCSKAATELAQKYVPDIEAHEDNEEGSVQAVGASQFVARYVTGRAVSAMGTAGLPGDTPGKIDGVGVAQGEDKDTGIWMLKPGDAILCRMTKPLVSLAFKLIREGIGCHVEGRDIGRSLSRLVDRWKVDTTLELTERLTEYRQKETAKLIARDARPALAALNDRIDTVFILMDGCNFVDEVKDKIFRLFKDSNGGQTNTVVLSTVHKAKGREWDRVFILGWGAYMPSKWATKDWMMEQEHNLIYVSITRTRKDLILLEALDR